MKGNQRKLDELDRQIITNVVHHDAEGEVISEEITCETSVELPMLTLATNEDIDDYLRFVENRARA